MCLSCTGKTWISVLVCKWSVFQNTVTVVLQSRCTPAIMGSVLNSLIVILMTSDLKEYYTTINEMSFWFKGAVTSRVKVTKLY